MVNPLPQTLDTALRSLSNDTWERLRDIKSLSAHPAQFGSVRLGEETITDLLMLDLNRQKLPSVRFIQTSRADEASQGTDFEWWVGAHGRGWFRFAIQAKKLHVQSARYRGLTYASKGKTQITRLEEYAKTNRAKPLYCLYNYSDQVDPSQHWHCCQRPFQIEELGCTITPSRNIQKAIDSQGMKNFGFIHSQPDTVPLRCLISCPKIRQSFPLVDSTATPIIQSPLVDDDAYHVELPQMLHVEALSNDSNYDGEVLYQELDPEFYNYEVGFPRWIGVSEFSSDQLDLGVR